MHKPGPSREYHSRSKPKPMNSGLFSKSGAGQKMDPKPKCPSGVQAAKVEAYRNQRKTASNRNDNGKR